MLDTDREFLSAVERGDIERVNNLIGHGADVRRVYEQGRTALHEAARVGAIEVAGVLIACGADVSAEDIDGCDPSWLALRNGYPNLAMLLEVVRSRPVKRECTRTLRSSWRKGILESGR